MSVDPLFACACDRRCFGNEFSTVFHINGFFCLAFCNGISCVNVVMECVSFDLCLEKEKTLFCCFLFYFREGVKNFSVCFSSPCIRGTGGDVVVLSSNAYLVNG